MDEPTQSPKQQAAEAAAIRRRWITLGEIVAVAAVVISGLTFWNAWQERTATEAERAESEREEAAVAGTVVLRPTVRDEGRQLTLAPLSAEQAIQGMEVTFPSALGVDPVETVADPRIEAGWFADELKDALEAAGREDMDGEARLPVAITTRFYADGRLQTDTAIYDIGYRLEGRFLQGRAVRLAGLSLVERTSDAGRLDQLWQQRQPTISSGLKK